MTTEATLKVQAKDVVRARRYGNKTKANYVIDRVIEIVPMKHALAVDAHREYGGGRGRFMVLDTRGARVLRSYREGVA